MNRICVLLASGAFCAAAFAQTKTPRPEFEVASVKPSPAQAPNQAAVGMHIDGAQLRMNYLPLRDYVRMAYRLKESQLAGPDWINSAYFDIAAKLPEAAPRDTVLDMLQSLLEERFELKAHRETREIPVYVLIQAKTGLKLQPLPEATGEPPRSFDVSAEGGPAGVTVNFGTGSSFSLSNNKFTVKNLTIGEFCDAISRFTDKQVVDLANAPGRYNFSVDLTSEDYMALLIRSAIKAGVTLPPEARRMIDGVSGESLFASLQTVGLKMESRKTPMEVMVVDQMLKTPKAN
jgi:uncharacterized protein (TIGR03435 family)